MYGGSAGLYCGPSTSAPRAQVSGGNNGGKLAFPETMKELRNDRDMLM